MKEKMKLERESPKEEMIKVEAKMEETMKLEPEAHREEMKKMEDQIKLDLNFLKVSIIKNRTAQDAEYLGLVKQVLRPYLYLSAAMFYKT